MTSIRRSADRATEEGQPTTSSPQQQQQDDPYLIAFTYKDPKDPRSWPEWKKWITLLLYLTPGVFVQMISSMFAPATNGAAEDVGVSDAAMRTVQAIYLYGFALGPVVVAPLSEDYGRKWVLVVSCFIVGLCQIPCALAGSIALMLPFRFIAGFFAATTFNAVGNVADLWDPIDQGWGVNTFSLAVEGGAYLGPIIGGYIYQDISWRWTFGAGGLMMGLAVIVITLAAVETRGGVILARIAAQKRKETGDDRYYCLHVKDVQTKTIKSRLTETLGRPIWMLFTEPIVVATAVFDGLNYMIIYGWILGLSLVYGNSYGFSTASAELPFFSILLGAILAFLCLPIQLHLERKANRKAEQVGTEVKPETALLWLWTAPLFPISLFWFAWTGRPGINYWSSIIALAVFGFVSHIIFVAVSTYTVACYSMYAASAVGAQSLARELASGSFTLFTVQMYEGLGYPWASSLLGFLAAVVSVLPFLLYIYGPKLRSRSPFCIEQIEATKAGRREQERLRSVANGSGTATTVGEKAKNGQETSEPIEGGQTTTATAAEP